MSNRYIIRAATQYPKVGIDVVIQALIQVRAKVLSSEEYSALFECGDDIANQISARWGQYGWETVSVNELNKLAPPLTADDYKLELYAVRNRDGQWFCAKKGYGSSVVKWVDDLASAKIYTKLGSARSRVTYLTTNYPGYGVPDIVKLSVTKAVIEDQTKRIKKLQKSRLKKELMAKKKINEQQIQSAKRRLKEAQDELDRLQNK